MGYDVPPVPGALLEDLEYTLGPAHARRWLEEAKTTAGRLIHEWDLVPLSVLTGGAESLCVHCRSAEGQELVLKVPASVRGGAAESAALQAWAGDGAPGLVRSDEDSSTMLMEFVGRSSRERWELVEVVDLVRRLHGADSTGHAFGSVADNLERRIRWARTRFETAGAQQQLEDLARAESLLDDLLETPGRTVLLHGDLQVKNLIRSTTLTAIDPMPTLGPEIFDVAFYLAKSGVPDAGPTPVPDACSLRPDLDLDTLMRWTWCLSVLENRPAVERGRVRRQAFIDGLRARFTSA